MTNWLEKVVALNVKPNSLQAYKFRFEHYISPKLGDEKVQSITPAIEIYKGVEKSAYKRSSTYNNIARKI